MSMHFYKPDHDKPPGTAICDKCDGRGYRNMDGCPYCGGLGLVNAIPRAGADSMTGGDNRKSSAAERTAGSIPATGARRFTMYRRNVPDATHNENQKNPPDQPQFEGVVFTDGTVAIRWMTAKRSTAIWSSMEDMLTIHGHPEYGSELVWHDGSTYP